MANYETLKSAIQQVVKTNGNNEITGALLQQSLLAMINSLGAGYQFMGVATPSTNPGTPDQRVFYIANGKGTYANFGGFSVDDKEVVIFAWDSSWVKIPTGIATFEKLSEIIGLEKCINLIYTKGVLSNNQISDFSVPSGMEIAIVGDELQLTNSTGSNLRCELNLPFELDQTHKYAIVSYIKDLQRAGFSVHIARYNASNVLRGFMYGTYISTSGVQCDIVSYSDLQTVSGKLIIEIPGNRTCHINTVAVFDLGDSTSEYYGITKQQVIEYYNAQPSYPLYLVKTGGRIGALEQNVASLEESVEEINEKLNPNRYPGLSLAFLGDSITYQGFNGIVNPYYSDGWIKRWCDDNKVDYTQVANRGIGGSWLSHGGTLPAMVDRWDSEGVNPSDTSLPLRVPGADILVIMGGTNDDNPSGDLTTLTNISTIVGALNTIVSGYLAKYPKALVVICTMIRANSQNESPSKQEDKKKKVYAQRIREYCEYAGIVCCDFYNETEINDFNTISPQPPVLDWTFENGYTINSYGIKVVASTYKLSQFVQVNAGQVYGISNGYVALYASNQESSFIGVIQKDEFEIPAGCNYIRVTAGINNVISPKNLTGITIKDTVHPSGLGHDRMSKIFNSVIQKIKIPVR